MGPVAKQDINDIIAANPALIEKLHAKSFFVTGATGMIGSYIARLLAEVAKRTHSTAKIIAGARNQAKAEEMFGEYLDMKNFQLLVGDVTEITELPSKVDYIIHAASPTQPQDFLERPVDIIHANVSATNNLLQIAQAASARFCLLSTLEIYGHVQAEHYPVSVKESDFGALDSLDLRSAYPESKRLAETLCVAFTQQYGVDSTIVRLAPIISPVIEPDDKRVFAQFVHDTLAGKAITVYSDAANKERSYTYIADAVTGILTAVLGSTPDNFVFNLAHNDNTISIQNLAEMISSHGLSPKKVNVVQRANDQNTSTTTGRVVLDAQKLRDLGWAPHYSLRVSIERIMTNVTST